MALVLVASCSGGAARAGTTARPARRAPATRSSPAWATAATTSATTA
ncbi:hypothetical protein ACFQ2B_22830 [Streptomyces stramineus]